METRHSVHPEDAKHYTTDKLREHFLCEKLFIDGELKMVYSHEDRVVIGGCVPSKGAVKLDAGDHFKTGFFLERREICIINVGKSTGKISVDGEEFNLDSKDGLYIGRGKKDVQLMAGEEGVPRFFMFSTLAHKEYETKKVNIATANPTKLGDDSTSNKRTIYKYVDGTYVQSCQLMMGMTLLEPNNMWNTMPCHEHDRRNEVYFYFDMDEDQRVFHYMGQPQETRHMVVANEQAIISPPWSIHSGVGTSNYTFIWAMAGENYEFTDMDHIAIKDLK